MEEIKYQIFLPSTNPERAEHGGEWTNLKPKLQLETGQVVRTKLLANGDLQYVRRTGAIGIAPAGEEYKDGIPRLWQWRRHPMQLLQSAVFSRAERPDKPIEQLPEGIEFE